MKKYGNGSLAWPSASIRSLWPSPPPVTFHYSKKEPLMNSLPLNELYITVLVMILSVSAEKGLCRNQGGLLFPQS